MSNANIEYKHTLGSWATGKSDKEVEASVQASTARQLGAWAKGEADVNGKPIKAGKVKGKKGAKVEETDPKDEQDLNGLTPADPLVS